MQGSTSSSHSDKLLNDDVLIVAQADLQGRIVDVNAELCSISGFSDEDLVGQSCHFLQHADMPAALFSDMNATLKTGRPWIGLVKHRCKHEGAFWIEAHVTPTYAHGEVDGFLYVGTHPNPQRVAAASSAYERYRQDKAGDLVIRQGEVVPARQSFDCRDLTISKRLLASFGLLLLMMILMGMLMMLGMHALWREMQSAGVADEVLQRAVDIMMRSRWQMLGLLGVFMASSGLLYFWLLQTATRPLNRVMYLCRQLASGNFNSAIGVTRNNEMGRLFQGLHCLQVTLRAGERLRRRPRADLGTEAQS